MICVNDEHSLKAYSPIEITEEGIVICVNDEHLENDPPAILVMNVGIITEFIVNFVQTIVSNISLFRLDLQRRNWSS